MFLAGDWWKVQANMTTDIKTSTERERNAQYENVGRQAAK